jgi:hypothetical protein
LIAAKKLRVTFGESSEQPHLPGSVQFDLNSKRRMKNSCCEEKPLFSPKKQLVFDRKMHLTNETQKQYKTGQQSGTWILRKKLISRAEIQREKVDTQSGGKNQTQVRRASGKLEACSL